MGETLKREEMREQIVEQGFVDIHTHILPGVDDGASNMAETKELLRAQIREGVSRIIATPHFDLEENRQDIAVLQKRLAEVRKAAAEISEDLSIFLGCEILYSHSILELLRENQIPAMAGTNYILVEFEPGQKYRDLFQAVRDIVLLGRTPIIAHAERYESLAGQEQNVRELIRQGAYIQVNTRSLLGGRFNKRTRFCMNLVKQHLVHFLGSDCHNMQYRPPKMREVVAVIEKTAGREAAQRLARKNGELLLARKYV